MRTILVCGCAIAIGFALWNLSGGQDEPAPVPAAPDELTADNADIEAMPANGAFIALAQAGQFQMTVLSSKIHDGQIAVLNTTTGHCWVIDTENHVWRDMGEPPAEDQDGE
jgi:hypothetical protein